MPKSVLNSRVVVALSGELDIARSKEMRTRLGAALGPNTASVIIDLAGVTFIDSSAIAELIRCRQSCAAAEAELFLTNLPSRIRRVFLMARLVAVFREGPDTEFDSSFDSSFG